MLSNAYFLAKFRFNAAENEPAKNLQNLENLPILLTRPAPHRNSIVRCISADQRFVSTVPGNFPGLRSIDIDLAGALGRG